MAHRRLNVRCGSDIRHALVLADGIDGDFLEYSDPVCDGPTPDVEDDQRRRFLEIRVAYIAEAYALPWDEVREKLLSEQSGLEGAPDYDSIVLWFEHDLYDQAILIRLLDWFASRPETHDKLFLICVDGFPGIERFTGLGQLSPEQLATLEGHRRRVTATQRASAVAAWRAYRSADPMPLAELVAEGSPDLPFLSSAMRRALQEYPWVRDGLGLTERLVLRALATGAETAGQVFGRYQCGDLQPYLGDLMLLPIFRRLASGARPLMSPFKGWCAPMAITDHGRHVLEGTHDWIALSGGVDRWIGGTHLIGREARWRWDDCEGRLVQ